MEVEQVEKLLVEYYGGNTTESQEEALKSYFKTTKVPVHLQKDKEIFLNLCRDADRDVEVPVGLADKLSLLIDKKAKEEQSFFNKNKAKRSWRWVGRIAATVLLLIALGYGIESMNEDMRPSTPKDTFSDPEQAYRVLQATLIEVSTNLNNGLNEVEKTQMDMREINREVQREIQK